MTFQIMGGDCANQLSESVRGFVSDVVLSTSPSFIRWLY